MMFQPSDFFDLSDESLSHLFNGVEYVWDTLKKLASEVKLLTASPQIQGEVHPTAVIEGAVSIGEGSVIGPHVHIQGPVYIGRHAVLRHGAYIRENSIIGDFCVVGHDSELKGSIMLTGSAAPHFAYLGDSILGRQVNLGAGTKLANLKLNGDEVIIYHEGEVFATGLRKIGAIIGDNTSIGCNVVTAPGTLIGRGCWIYSSISLRGIIPARSVVKHESGFRIEPKR